VFTSEQLPGILDAYMAGIKSALAVALAACVISVFAAALNDWRRLQKPSTDTGANGEKGTEENTTMD
jgi:hypothetical protein